MHVDKFLMEINNQKKSYSMEIYPKLMNLFEGKSTLKRFGF